MKVITKIVHFVQYQKFSSHKTKQGIVGYILFCAGSIEKPFNDSR